VTPEEQEGVRRAILFLYDSAEQLLALSGRHDTAMEKLVVSRAEHYVDAAGSLCEAFGFSLHLRGRPKEIIHRVKKTILEQLGKEV
jgi:hypothetical protein